jgi:hypothetical protein
MIDNQLYTINSTKTLSVHSYNRHIDHVAILSLMTQQKLEVYNLDSPRFSSVISPSPSLIQCVKVPSIWVLAAVSPLLQPHLRPNPRSEGPLYSL